CLRGLYGRGGLPATTQARGPVSLSTSPAAHYADGGAFPAPRRGKEGHLMLRRLLAPLGTAFILLSALLWSRGERPAGRPPAVKLPRAFGPIPPRLSPDGSTIAFSYQGEIWTGPRTGGTMTLLVPSEGFDTEPAWSPDGKQVAFVRAGAVKLA